MEYDRGGTTMSLTVRADGEKLSNASPQRSRGRSLLQMGAAQRFVFEQHAAPLGSFLGALADPEGLRDCRAVGRTRIFDEACAASRTRPSADSTRSRQRRRCRCGVLDESGVRPGSLCTSLVIRPLYRFILRASPAPHLPCGSWGSNYCFQPRDQSNPLSWSAILAFVLSSTSRPYHR